MKKGNKIYIITIVILLVVVIVLSVLLVVRATGNTEIKYTGYNDQLIEIDQSSGIQSIANIVDNSYLGVLVTSDVQGIRTITAEVVFYDDQNKKVLSNETSDIMVNEGQLFFTFALPDLADDVYAGTIELKLTEGEEEGFENLADTAKISFQETHSVNEAQNTVFNITVLNENSNNLSSMFANLVAVKDNKIIAYNSSSLENIPANAPYNFTIELPGVWSGGEIQPIDFDEVYLFATNAYYLAS